ncbi:hypothetical protein O6H91_17G066400 [Diphasiastrum complanatum]|uniref:Uncharacterized protein n=1 Tax=Diphasiastrum complanatum TaxID=34168 RepID=A0ACC2B7N9_DIPCM|nr:hypothetical protein O6H91_17G066400 [Diphasiastrum complanatum]
MSGFPFIRSASSLFQVRGLQKQEVILTEKIKRLGEAGQIVKVAPGYARNKLIPQMLALPALEKYVLLVRNQLKALPPEEDDSEDTDKIKQEEQKKKDELDKVLRRLDSGRVVIRRNVGERTILRQCVTKTDLVSEVRRQLGVQLQDTNIAHESDFSTLGDGAISWMSKKQATISLSSRRRSTKHLLIAQKRWYGSRG